MGATYSALPEFSGPLFNSSISIVGVGVPSQPLMTPLLPYNLERHPFSHSLILPCFPTPILPIKKNRNSYQLIQDLRLVNEAIIVLNPLVPNPKSPFLNFSITTCLPKDSQLYFLYNTAAFLCLPPGWTGQCALVSILSAVSLHYGPIPVPFIVSSSLIHKNKSELTFTL